MGRFFKVRPLDTWRPLRRYEADVPQTVVLLQGYFENAKDLGDRSFLVPQAVEANVFASADEVRLRALSRARLSSHSR